VQSVENKIQNTAGKHRDQRQAIVIQSSTTSNRPLIVSTEKTAVRRGSEADRNPEQILLTAILIDGQPLQRRPPYWQHFLVSALADDPMDARNVDIGYVQNVIGVLGLPAAEFRLHFCLSKPRMCQLALCLQDLFLVGSSC
jgi:hypothetical protein